MYTDAQPCRECGSPVRLEPREPDREQQDGPVGPEDGVVGTADPTVDRRICTNPDCPTHAGDDAPPA